VTNFLGEGGFRFLCGDREVGEERTRKTEKGPEAVKEVDLQKEIYWNLDYTDKARAQGQREYGKGSEK